jgi:tRNA1(Val) A37 N6-methylase TrmN6
VNADNATLDRFLGGRVVAAQPAKGFRAGHDTVLLAAAVPAAPGSAVLELGSGAGVASLCLAARVDGVRITGIEIDSELVALANENAARNGVAERVRFVASDVAQFAARKEAFDHVFFNPPFHRDSGNVSPSGARDLAKRDTAGSVQIWTRAALAMTNSCGSVTAIIRTDREADLLAAASGFGGIVFPLFPRAGETPKRTIVRIVKDGRSGFARAAGLVLHETGGKNTSAAEAILRHAGALDLGGA